MSGARALMVPCRTLRKLDSLLQVVPMYRLPRAAILDTLLGPAEQFEYVSTTAPEAPH